jgi:hypothetical protein
LEPTNDEFVIRIRAEVALPDEKAEASQATFGGIMARNVLMELTAQSWTAEQSNKGAAVGSGEQES